MKPTLEELAARAKTAIEIEVRMERFLGTGETPSPALIKQTREYLGLSQVEFANALGFTGTHGERTIAAFETGKRNGSAFSPTRSISRLMRAFVVAKLARRLIMSGDQEKAALLLYHLLPDHLRTEG